MNKRIRELYEQAMEQHVSNNMAWEELNPEKFAELLVRKCAEIALKKGMESPDTDFRTGSHVINGYLLTYFGVEE